VRVLEQPGELPATLGAIPAGFVLDILGGNLMPRPGTPLPKGYQLVLRILPAVIRAYPRVNGNPHRYSPKIRVKSMR
jgi:hypothetical protein